MRKTIIKIIITVLSLVVFMMLLPWLAIKFADGWATTGLWMFAFFTVNPALVIGLSIMAGTELRRLWWIPLAISALFPVLFGVAIGEFVWDLYVYSAIYLPIGILAMLGTHFGKKLILKKKAVSGGMKMKKVALLVLSIATLIFELLPYGVVLNFANPDGEPWRRTYSYFSLTPFGYANFGPLITAILTCILLVLAVVYHFKSHKGLNIAIMNVSGLATATSLLPLMFGFSYITVIGVIVSVLLAATFAVCFIKIK